MGAIIPLLPWIIVATGNVMWWSIGLAGVATLLVGGGVGHFTKRGVSYSALRALVIMAVASAEATFGVGALVGH